MLWPSHEAGGENRTALHLTAGRDLTACAVPQLARFDSYTAIHASRTVKGISEQNFANAAQPNQAQYNVARGCVTVAGEAKNR